LHALHVELGTTLAVSLVQGDDLGAKEVFAGCEVRQRDAVFAFVGDEVVNGPFTVGEAFLGELDPDVALAV
jgi:hypothetical protein